MIDPGVWDPTTPIVFGGESLEAAVREAYYDPARRLQLRKSMSQVIDGIDAENESADDVDMEVVPEASELVADNPPSRSAEEGDAIQFDEPQDAEPQNITTDIVSLKFTSELWLNEICTSR